MLPAHILSRASKASITINSQAARKSSKLSSNGRALTTTTSSSHSSSSTRKVPGFPQKVRNFPRKALGVMTAAAAATSSFPRFFASAASTSSEGGAEPGGGRPQPSDQNNFTTQACSSTADPRQHFYAAALEAGQERQDLPLWALRPEISVESAFPFLESTTTATKEGTAFDRETVTRRDLPDVPGGFQLLNVLTSEECSQIVKVLDGLGFHQDAAVSLPYSFRHMSNCNLVAPDSLTEELFRRSKHLLPELADYPALGINAKFRCYRYGPGDYFKAHTDGAWPGTRVVNGVVEQDSYGDRISQLTYLILLSDDFVGGETQFFPDGVSDGGPAVRTPKGAVLCFPHGMHPGSLLHSGMQVISGFKYMIRTEVLYSLESVRALRDKHRRFFSQL